MTQFANPVATATYDGESTWADRGTGSRVGAVKLITDIGNAAGAYMAWDGTYWKVMAPTDVVFDTTSQDAAALNTSEQIIKQAAIPAGLLFAGRSFSVKVLWGKSGTTDAATTHRLRLGTAGTTGDTQLTTPGPMTSGNRTFSTASLFFLSSTTQVRVLGHINGLQEWAGGASGAAYPVNYTISNAVSNALILSASIQMAGSSDRGQVHHMVLTLNP